MRVLTSSRSRSGLCRSTNFFCFFCYCTAILSLVMLSSVFSSILFLFRKALTKYLEDRLWQVRWKHSPCGFCLGWSEYLVPVNSLMSRWHQGLELFFFGGFLHYYTLAHFFPWVVISWFTYFVCKDLTSTIPRSSVKNVES